MQDIARAIIIDWGTSSFRAMLVAADGRVCDQRATHQGIATLAGGDFAGVLLAAIAPWRQAHGLLPIIAAGMIGSRNGWIEMPYVPVPADARAIAAAARRITLPDGGSMLFLPGLTDPAAWPFPDVMRGEETQLVGFGLARDGIAVLPGTHSKWARIAGGRITGFKTFATGELYATMLRHSFIAGMAAAAPQEDPAAFARGLATLRDAPAPLGLLGSLFAARTGWLAGALAASEIADFLSGLVIAAEFAEARGQGWFAPGDELAVIGDAGLTWRYAAAAAGYALHTVTAGAETALRGCLALARLAEETEHAA